MGHVFGPIDGPVTEYGDGATAIFFGSSIIAALVFMALLTEFFRRKSHPEQKTLLKERFYR